MSTRNFVFQRKNSTVYKVKTATATLTKAELDGGFVICNHASTPVVLTLPVATSLYKGCVTHIANKGAAAATVYVAAGFGGAGGTYDTLTLARGDMYIVASDGVYWYDTGFATAGAG